MVPVQTVAPILIGALFFVLGFVSRRLRPNWFVGIRTPWTLMSRRSWTKTHEAAQWVFMIAGMGSMAGGLLTSSKVLVASVVFLAVGVLTLVVYSYLLWRDDPERISPASSLHAD